MDHALAAFLEERARFGQGNGLLVVDNVISHAGQLADYLARVKSHPALFSVTVPVGKGRRSPSSSGDARTDARGGPCAADDDGR